MSSAAAATSSSASGGAARGDVVELSTAALKCHAEGLEDAGAAAAAADVDISATFAGRWLADDGGASSSFDSRDEISSEATPGEAAGNEAAGGDDRQEWSVPDTVGDGAYSVGKLIGGGSFGRIHLVRHTTTGKFFAMKSERNGVKHRLQLHHEDQMLRAVAGVGGFPAVHYSGMEPGTYVIVMDLLGPSLEELFVSCGNKFSVKTVLLIGVQLMNRLESLHARSILHRDIKPSNLLIGKGRTQGAIYLVDLGFAKQYRDPKTMTHIPERRRSVEGAVSGTARYASINAHTCVEQSRRDDLESVGYMLLYFLKGSLPWQGIRADSTQERNRLILECKKAHTVQKLCEGEGAIFSAYLSYCRVLRFADRPDYAYMRRCFAEQAARGRILLDYWYDWLEPPPAKDNEPEAQEETVLVGPASGDVGAGGGDEVWGSLMTFVERLLGSPGELATFAWDAARRLWRGCPRR